ncbi:MAG: helix-hairpin-helix domain-containing protein [Gloeobacterales cyanobacterium]|jgi:competence protein ComEA
MFFRKALPTLVLALSTLLPLPVLAQAPTTAPAPTQTKPATKAPETAPKSKKSTTAQVNVNSSTEKELQQVKGIGAKTAKKIVAGRPYKSLDDLVSKKVMSAKQLETLKAQLAL